jgi:tyrosinase
VWVNQGGRKNPNRSAWRDEPFDFHRADRTAVQMTSTEVVDPGSLGYEYEELAVPELVAAGGGGVPPEPPPDRPPELVGATEGPLTLAGQSEQVAIPLSEPTGPAALTESTERPRVYVNVEGIQGERNPGVSYAVYVNLPDDEDPGSAQRYHVGNVSFFGIERARDVETDHRGGPGLRYAFDITDLANMLESEGRWDPAQVKVSFEPIRSLPPTGEEAVPAPVDVPPVTIGRVGIYYQ